MALDIMYYGEQFWNFEEAPERTDAERIAFIEKYNPSFDELSDWEENNQGYSHEMFSVISQHLNGRSHGSLIDAGIWCAEHPSEFYRMTHP